MTITGFGFESGSNGDTATSGNTGMGTPVITNGAASFQISTGGTPPEGTRCLLMTGLTGTGTGNGYVPIAIGSTSLVRYDMDLKIDPLPSGECYFVWVGTGGTSTRGFAIAMATDGKIRIRDSANAAKWKGAQTTSTTALSTGTWYRISVVATSGAGTGTFQVVIYAADGTTVIEDTTSQTSQALGTGWDQARLGPKPSNGTLTVALRADRVRYDLTGSGLLPAPASIPPVLPGTIDLTNYGVWVDLSATTYQTGPMSYSASPSTGVTSTSTAIFLPAEADGSTTTYTLTATDTGNGQTDTESLDVALPISTQDVIETVVWNGSAWV